MGILTESTWQQQSEVDRVIYMPKAKAKSPPVYGVVPFALLGLFKV